MTTDEAMKEGVAEWRKMVQQPKNGKFKQWKQDVEATAELHGIEWTLPELIVHPDGISIAVKRTILRNVVSTIRMKCPEDVENRTDTNVRTKNPHDVLTEMERVMVQESEVLRNNLRTEAEMTKIGSKSVEDYFEEHMDMRTKMLRAAIPGIADERMTINYIVNGLHANDKWSTAFQTMTLNKPRNLEDMKQSLLLIEKNIEEQKVTHGSFSGATQYPGASRWRSRGSRTRGYRGRGGKSRWDEDNDKMTKEINTRVKAELRKMAKSVKANNAVAEQKDEQKVEDKQLEDKIYGKLLNMFLAKDLRSGVHYIHCPFTTTESDIDPCERQLTNSKWCHPAT